MRYILILAAAILLPLPATANDWLALRAPGAFAIMRHALAPGTGDPPGFAIGDCTTQRNLDENGREQARRIGTAFKERGLAFDVVLTSQWCRCRETAELLDIGPVEEASALNSFFGDYARRDAQTAAALDLIKTSEKRMFLVTHQVNISALTGKATRSGEVLVVRPDGERLIVIGEIMIGP